MESYRGYKFRIYPTKKQKETIEQIIRNANFVYNYFIRQQQKYYSETGKFIPLAKCIKELPELKKKFPELKKGESTSLQQSLRHLDRAYTNFFNKRSQYPRFKSNRFDHNYTCTKNGCTPSNIRMEEGMIVLPKLGKVKIKLHRDLKEDLDITSATVQRNQRGKYEVTLQAKTEIEKKENPDKKVLGIVYSPVYFFVASDGSHGEIPESYLKTQERINQLKQNLKRKQPDSANRQKENQKLKKAYEKSRNIKKDFLHKWSKEIANNYSVVAIMENPPESTDIKESSQSGWSLFLQLLTYKLEEKGGEIIPFSLEDLENLKFDSLGEEIKAAKTLKEKAEQDLRS